MRVENIPSHYRQLKKFSNHVEAYLSSMSWTRVRLSPDPCNKLQIVRLGQSPSRNGQQSTQSNYLQIT